MRTWEREVAYCQAIEKKWGWHIISYLLKPGKVGGLLNGRVNVPAARCSC